MPPHVQQLRISIAVFLVFSHAPSKLARSTMELNHPGGFRSRRSYPNLHHVSLAPLTPKFPIDDDTDPADYFGQHDDDENTGSGARTPPRTSYISSVSVPSTPPILSHSRSTSRSRHGRSKSSTSAAGGFSDTNLQSRAEILPLHHQPGATKKRPSSSHARRQPGESSHAKSKSDAEWMLRAGIALASSTREEKGQSWLSKRESSTSLVSMPHDEAAPHHRHHHRTKSGGASSRKSRSGASTPVAYSRRSSRATSRRGSRAGLTMTTMPPSSLSSAAGKAPSPGTETPSPEMSRRSSIQVPDFVDERIRAEMASLQERERLLLDDESEYWERDENSSEYSYSSEDTQDEFDEADLQRLTRERGFGLGSWIDRLVEWTLFGVDEWPAPMSPAAAATRIGATPTTTTVTFEDPPATPSNREQDPDTFSVASVEGDHHSDDETRSHTEGDSATNVEKAGSQGGWEDASWLFRVVKRALL